MPETGSYEFPVYFLLFSAWRTCAEEHPKIAVSGRVMPEHFPLGQGGEGGRIIALDQLLQSQPADCPVSERDPLPVSRFFQVKGKITSNYKIKKVTVAVYTKAGKKKLSVTKKPNKKSYDLKKLSKKVKFKKLKKGTYYYKVTATDSQKTKVLQNKKFVVK